MNKDAIVGLLQDNDKLVAVIIGAAITLFVAAPVAFIAGSLNYSIESRIARVEAQVKMINERYVSIVERGELPASIERRLSEIEGTLTRIENRLDKQCAALEATILGRISNE